MNPSITWRLMFRVANRAAFERCIARTLPLLGSGWEADEGHPYWKIPELWECNVVCPLPGVSVADQVLGCILVAHRLASGWYILGSLSAESAVGFSGVFSRGQNGSFSTVAWLEWASFDVVTSEMNAAFQPMEVVEVIAEFKVTVGQSQRLLTGETGFVAGWTDPYEDGHRDYAVHFNSLGEVIVLPEQSLKSLGRIADRSEVVTRSRAHRSSKRRSMNDVGTESNFQAG